MKKITALLLTIALIFAMCGCGGKKAETEITEKDAEKYLTSFFSSYTQMNNYLKNSGIAISAFALDGEGLSSILKACYQAQSVTFAFGEPVKVAPNTFSVSVTVAAPDIEPLYQMYAIDRILAEDELPDSFVSQSFYDNICAGTTSTLTSTVNITLRYDLGVWTVDPSNDLAFAIFPNIDKAG